MGKVSQQIFKNNTFESIFITGKNTELIQLLPDLLEASWLTGELVPLGSFNKTVLQPEGSKTITH